MEALKKYCKRYFIDGLGAMAVGLFATLIIGTIIAQIGTLVSLFNTEIGIYITAVANMAKTITGAGIGLAVAVKYKQSGLLAASAAVCGMLGAFPDTSSFKLGAAGEPLGAFIAALVAIEVGRLVSGKTKLDIILTPLVSITAGSITAFLLSKPISVFMSWLGGLVNIQVQDMPVIGGIIVSVLMGIFLTLPISSAAIGISLELSGIAAGAACIGCCCQMVGFAVASFRDNGVGGLVAQGIGTSMLQMPNIMRKPQIWISPIIASAILGPISTAVFGMVNNKIGSGMGTSGLVGQINAFAAMTEAGTVWWQALILIVVMHIILPAVLVFFIDLFLRKIGVIKPGDMKLSKI